MATMLDDKALATRVVSDLGWYT